MNIFPKIETLCVFFFVYPLWTVKKKRKHRIHKGERQREVKVCNVVKIFLLVFIWF